MAATASRRGGTSIHTPRFAGPAVRAAAHGTRHMSSLFKPPGPDNLASRTSSPQRQPQSTDDPFGAADSGPGRQSTNNAGLYGLSEPSKSSAFNNARSTSTDGAGTRLAQFVPPSGSLASGMGRNPASTTDLRPKDDPFEVAAMRTRQAVKSSRGPQDGQRATATAQPATPRAAPSSPPARPTIHFEGTGSPPSEAAAAQAAAAYRQRSSLFHDSEGAATDMIPDLAMTLGTMALPFAPAITAQMAPRFAQRLLPKLLLPEYDGATSGVLFTNEGRIVRLQSGTPDPAYRNYVSAKHAEGKAALWLRENNSSGGALFHNNPGGTCGFCDLQAQTLLPKGVNMRIVPPANAVATKKLAQTDMIPYVGDSKIPKPPRPGR